MTAAHPTIEHVAEEAGYDLNHASSVRRMQAHFWRDIPPADVELIQLRLDLGSDRALAHLRSRRRPSAVAQEVDYAVLRVIAPVAHEIPLWRSWHDSGESLDVIATRAGAPVTVVRLAIDGLTGRPDEVLIGEQLAAAGRRWRAGDSDADVAQAMGRSATWLRSAMRSGRLHLTPTRLHRSDIARIADVTTTLAGRWDRRGLLPAADGQDTHGRWWWWQSTVDAWTQETLTHACPYCRSRMPTLAGLRVHVSKQHRSR